MGQKLSCVSKQKGEETTTQPCYKKIRVASKKKVTSQSESKSESAPIVKATAATAQSAANHVDNAESVRRRTKLVLLKPAPAKLDLPLPLPVQSSETVSPTDTDYIPQDKANRSGPGTPNEPQTVDQFARELAQGEARPATWADLYWHLIENRKLPNDKQKIKAIFSWLCSLPLDKDAFVTLEELEQGVKDGIQYAAEVKKKKNPSVSPESPEFVVNEFIRGKVTYLRAFESLCRYTGIPCCTIKGLAKGVDYTVGMSLTDQKVPPDPNEASPIGQIQHAWSAARVDGKWSLFDSMWAAERLAMSANARQSQIGELGQIVYETDMFYFNTDPAIFIHSHYPFESSWQLLKPPVTLKQFQDGVLLKPAFFTHGLGLFSHHDGVIPVQNKLILKLSIPPDLIKQLLFTFNLKLEGKDELIQGVNLSRFGMHDISIPDGVVTFNFRFPKSGAYKLTIYARKVGDPLFTDCCEYRVEARGVSAESFGDTTKGSIEIPPFPPTSQASYGPTEKANELKVRLVPADTPAVTKCSTGVFEVRFNCTDPSVKLARLTARLRSLLFESSMLTDCILTRTVEPSATGTLVSTTSESSTSVLVPTCFITAYLPAAGEYALEVYGAPADAPEDTSYFLVWQFLIDADTGVKLSTPVRKRIATTILGPREPMWTQLGLRTVSHPDPVIHVPTKGMAGLQKTRSKSEVMQEYVQRSEKLDAQRGETKADASVVDESIPAVSVAVDETPDPRDCDLKIVVQKPAAEKVCLLGELIDITETEEQSLPNYMLQQLEEIEETSGKAEAMERITYLIRIPHGNHFYKFHLYGALVDTSPTFELPLIYTYVLEAPQRLMASEVPYVGAKYGAFPEKLEQQKEQVSEGDKQS